MKCQYCGSEISVNDKTCPFCEAPVNHSSQSDTEMKSDSVLHKDEGATGGNSRIAQNHTELKDGSISRSKMLAAKIAGLGMIWYHIVLILLIFDVVVCLGYAVLLLTGYIYTYEIGSIAISQGFIQSFYQAYPLMKFTDVFFGILEVGFAVLSGIAFYMLKKFKRNAFKVLLLSYALPILALLIRNIIESLCFNTLNQANMLELMTGLIVPIVFILINYLYFKKRAFLFDQ